MFETTLQSHLPPVDIVRNVGRYADMNSAQTVLDAGCGNGRNSLFLAGEGHEVLGITNDPLELAMANRLAIRLGETAGRCTFRLDDLSTMPVTGSYDILLNNEVLHLLSRPVATDLLRRLRLQTKPNGLNVVSGYLWQEGLKSPSNLAQCLRPNELHDIYERVGWHILDYAEQTLPLQYIEGREIMSSRAKLVAQRTLSGGRAKAAIVAA